MYLDADPVLTPLLHGLATDTNPARHLDFLQRTLLSRPNIEELVRLTDLDVGINSQEAKEALYQQLAAEVQIRAIAPNLMTISYRNKDPLVAKNVVQSLLTIFSEKTAGSSRSEMDMTALLTELTHRFSDRFVILDTPPCMVSSDAATMAPLVGQIVFVVEAYRTQQDEIEASVGMLNACPRISLLLNKSAQVSAHFGSYRYDYRYPSDESDELRRHRSTPA